MISFPRTEPNVLFFNRKKYERQQKQAEADAEVETYKAAASIAVDSATKTVREFNKTLADVKSDDMTVKLYMVMRNDKP